MPPRPAAQRSGGHARPRPERTPRKRVPRDRIAALIIVVIGVIVLGTAVGFDSEASAEPTVQGFLLDWQQQDYAAAGALTTGTPSGVGAELSGAFSQLDATALFLSMDSVVQHGGSAVATFTASVDLAADSRVWTYKGSFDLSKSGGNWLVDWSPSDIVPGLQQGDRLGVITTFPSRGLVLDSAGQPLQSSAQVYLVGVVPAKLTNLGETAADFASVTGVEAAQVSGQIAAAPPEQFLKLASLDPDTYAKLRGKLARVPGLVIKPKTQVLYKSLATGLVGTVGSEVNRALRAEGAFYLPGTTIGLSGLEQVYQRQLLGSPTTSVVVLNQAGQVTGQLMHWQGTAGQPVLTTISTRTQNAAIKALDSVPNSGELVAVQASTGNVLADAQHLGSGALPAGGTLDAKLSPGTAFTIVSTAALLESGLTANTPISCTNSYTVGGQTFSSYGTGSQKPFSVDFADDCKTAFAGLSTRLTAPSFAAVVQDFGLGTAWPQMPVPVFPGSVPTASDEADLAAETIGGGNVQVSPLAMALVAAEVDNGSWHAPTVLTNQPSPAGASGAPLDSTAVSGLRELMWEAVRSGAAHGASVPGAPVYGQVGLTNAGSNWLSWFVGYRGDVAFTLIEAGKTPQLSSASLAGAFLSALGSAALSG
jgi:cell division protein FtsI/penicillin-binding protein 2